MSCCSPTSFSLVLTTHKGVCHSPCLEHSMLMAAVVMAGGRGARVSWGTPTQPCCRAGMSLTLLTTWSGTAEVPGVQLSWGTAWFCLTYWEQSSVHPSWCFSPKPASTVPSLCRSARRMSLFRRRRRGEKGDCALLLDGQMQPDERSRVPTAHSQLWNTAQHRSWELPSPLCLPSGKTPPFQSFSRGNALPALLWFISCFVGAELQMAAHYNCTRNGGFWSGLWLQCWMENPQSAVGSSKRQGWACGSQASLCSETLGHSCGASLAQGTSPSLPGARLQETHRACKTQRKRRIPTCRGWGWAWVSPHPCNKSCPEVMRPGLKLPVILMAWSFKN